MLSEGGQTQKATYSGVTFTGPSRKGEVQGQEKTQWLPRAGDGGED